jgi:hypothetical protein
MSLTKRQIGKLNKIVDMAQSLLDSDRQSSPKAASSNYSKRSSGPGRKRRSSADAEKMRADILAKRAKGVSAAVLAKKYGVSTAYVYMIK